MENRIGRGPWGAGRAVAASTAAFTVCFAVWMMNGVLVTFLVDAGVYTWDKASVGWLIGTPVLTGSILRLPAGMLADRYGGRAVMSLLMLLACVPVYLVSHIDSYWGLLLAGLGVGIAGSSFAVGVAYVSAWFPPERQGMALGIFGMGNSGAALTTLVAPSLLNLLTRNGADPEAWRTLPKLYAAALAMTALVFWLVTDTTKTDAAQNVTLRQRLAPLRQLRAWRFGLYYAFTFGSFVALSQWLMPYYVSVYSTSVATAGLLAAAFSLPSGVVRALGGWVSDRVGPRTVLYWTLGSSVALLVLLSPPRMEVQAPGQGVMADGAGTVTAASDREVVVGADRYVLQQVSESAAQIRVGIHRGPDEEGFHLLPTASFRQVPIVEVGARVAKGQLLARGVTQVYFQANMWIFTALALLVGVMMGLASGAVFKHIPSYFPGRVGVVGGIVGVLGGLGGFAEPILFGYLLAATGIWTSCWIFLALFALVCLVWMHVVIRRMMHASEPELMREFDLARHR